jgi:fibronectin type 3 domain-containing protein
MTWKRAALAAALVVLALPLTACHGTSELLFCLFSGGAASPECQTEALAPGPPSPPVEVAATSTPPGVELRWPASLEPDVRAYRIYRSERQGGPYAFLTRISAESSAALDETAPGCVRMYYVVTALDALDQESERSAEAATTCGPPARPAGLRAFGFATSVLLVWSASREPDFAGYHVFELEPESGVPRKLDDELLAQPEFHVTGLAPLTTHVFLVTAVDTAGRQSLPAEVGPVKTVEGSGIPPTAPTGLTVLRHVSAGHLDWADNPEPDVIGYHVYRADAAAGPFTRISSALVRDSGYVTDVEREQWLRVTAVNSSDQEGPPSEAVRATPGPAAPAGLTATAGNAQVTLAWSANTEPDLAGYDVYARLPVTDEPEQKVNSALLTATSFIHTGLDNGVEVRYRVRAVDTDGNAGPSAEASATPRAPASTPTGLTATPGDHQVALDWDDNPELDLTGYDVQMASSAAGPFNTVLRRPVTVSAHTVVDLPLTTWWFRVVALGPFGRSEPSAVVSATPCPAICQGPALARLLRRPAAVVSRSFPFELAVSGEPGGGGSGRRDGADIVGTGFELAGTFELDRAPKGLDPELRELVEGGLGGGWRSRFDWRLTPAAGTARLSGVALATFADQRVGVACLRLDETTTAKRRGRERYVVTHGELTFLGGSATAAALLGDGSYAVETRADGTRVYEGRATPAGAAAPLPLECEALRGG